MRRTLWLNDRLARQLDGHIAALERERGSRVAWGGVVNEALSRYLADVTVADADDGAAALAHRFIEQASDALRLAEAALRRQAMTAVRLRKQQTQLPLPSSTRRSPK